MACGQFSNIPQWGRRRRYSSQREEFHQSVPARISQISTSFFNLRMGY
jgi:hypothetical protein